MCKHTHTHTHVCGYRGGECTYGGVNVSAGWLSCKCVEATEHKWWIHQMLMIKCFPHEDIQREAQAWIDSKTDDVQKTLDWCKWDYILVCIDCIIQFCFIYYIILYYILILYYLLDYKKIYIFLLMCISQYYCFYSFFTVFNVFSFKNRIQNLDFFINKIIKRYRSIKKTFER